MRKNLPLKTKLSTKTISYTADLYIRFGKCYNMYIVNMYYVKGLKMRTPTEYTRNLKNKIITEKMLLDCLYSCNKRAKNWRDKEREYRDYYRSNYNTRAGKPTISMVG